MNVLANAAAHDHASWLEALNASIVPLLNFPLDGILPLAIILLLAIGMEIVFQTDKPERYLLR